MKDDELRIIIEDDQGNVVVDKITKAFMASQEEIDDMVAMINHGTPAWLASKLVMIERKE